MDGEVLTPFSRYEGWSGEMEAVEYSLKDIEKRPLLCNQETFSQECEQTRV